jgi:hypothetical protein
MASGSTPAIVGALERGDSDAIASALSPDVTFHTPILTTDLEGRDLTLRFLSQAAQTIDGLTYYDSAADSDRTMLFWRGRVAERDIEGITVIVTDDAELVTDVTVLLRSWTIVALFRDSMLIALADAVPASAWGLQDDKAPTPDTGAGCGPAPTHELAPDVRFHSPMLTRTVSGEENVHAIHRLIGGIQGPREYHARIEQDDRVVEYWTCVIDGHPQQGVDVLDLDDRGRVTDQHVWLRPWPVTTILRDRAMAGQLPFLGPDVWLLPAHPIPLA